MRGKSDESRYRREKVNEAERGSEKEGDESWDRREEMKERGKM